MDKTITAIAIDLDDLFEVGSPWAGTQEFPEGGVFVNQDDDPELHRLAQLLTQGV